MTEKHSVIVVGGGISGLTAATYLARDGIDVLLLEKNEFCGGLVSSFERNGFVFDGGVRALLNAGIIQPMLRELGIELDIVPSPVSVGIEDCIIHVENEKSLSDYARMLKQLYPESAYEVDRVISVIRRIMNDMKILYELENPLFNNFLADKKYFLTVYLPWFFKFLFALASMNKLSMPVEDYLARIISNRSLADAISQHFFRGTPAFFALSYFYLYLDYSYPRGGMGSLSEALLEKFIQSGGKIRKNTRVIAIDLDSQTVSDEHGKKYGYQELIWAADLRTLYQISKASRPNQNALNERDRVLAGKGADSVYTIYVAVDIPPEKFADISHGHFFYTPHRQGLGDIHRSELGELLGRWPEVSKQELHSWMERFCKYNSYEISIPALRDPALAPEGKTGLIISTLFDYELVRKVSERGWYDWFKAELESLMLNRLSSTIYPGLVEKLEFTIPASPLTIEERIGSSFGSIVGWSFAGEIPVTTGMFRINQSVKTSLPHVWKCGQWAFTPTGVPTCVLTGKLAAEKVKKVIR